MYAINPDGTKRWEFATEGPIVATPALAADGTLYVGSDDRNLYALNATGGTATWHFSANAGIESSPTVVQLS
jgi:outer membrane protein assembly factor BamB